MYSLHIAVFCVCATTFSLPVCAHSSALLHNQYLPRVSLFVYNGLSILRTS